MEQLKIPSPEPQLISTTPPEPIPNKVEVKPENEIEEFLSKINSIINSIRTEDGKQYSLLSSIFNCFYENKKLSLAKSIINDGVHQDILKYKNKMIISFVENGTNSMETINEGNYLKKIQTIISRNKCITVQGDMVSIDVDFVHSHKLLIYRNLFGKEIDIVKNRVTFKDLKTLEEAIMSQMENLKLLFVKKFADKNDVNKAMKYLDQQIKNIIQIYIKKIEKGDNWLLSKKPISSNLCASCESYIGDLNDINEDNKIYIPWNKYPVKDSNDKLYRLGQGYSNILQIVETEKKENKTERNNNNIINLNKTVSGFGFIGKKIKIPNEKKRTIQNSLPKLRGKEVMKKVNSTFSEKNNIDIKINTDSDDGDEKPIITKIFRVNKEK